MTKEHNLKVAERGEFVTIGGIEFAIDKFKVKHFGILDKIAESFFADNTDLAILLSEEGGLLSIGLRFGAMVRQKEVFRNNVIVALMSITENNKVIELEVKDIIELSFNVVTVNKDHFVGKFHEMVEETTAMIKIIDPNLLNQ